MRRIDASEARRSFSKIYHEVAYGGERVVIANHGKALAALVPIADLTGAEGKVSRFRAPAPDRATCLALLRKERSALKRAGVRRAALFGSVARGEAHPDSDIDVLVDLDPKAHVGFVRFIRLEEQLRKLFGRKVDLVSRGGLRERDPILAEAVYAF